MRPASPEKRERFHDLSAVFLQGCSLIRITMASFFILSVALHLAIVLSYPVSPAGHGKERYIPLTLLYSGEPGASATGKAPPPKARISARAPVVSTPEIAPRRRARLKAAVEKNNKEEPPDTVSDQAAATVAGVAPVFNAAEGGGIETSEMDEKDRALGGGLEHGGGGRESSIGGPGPGASGIGTEKDHGGGNGLGPPQLQHTQASFRHAPPPEYPDAARKEGKKGRVLLRVLVDEEGKSKIVEINHSSGSSVLDQAAAEAIKRWRFAPARYGATPVASWVKIPVDFDLKTADR